MLGYVDSRSNNVYVFFEGDEIERLGSEKINGIYFNESDLSRRGLLEASLREDISCVETSIVKDKEGFVTTFSVLIRRRDYDEKLLPRGIFGPHQGFRHVNLMSVEKIPSNDLFTLSNYELLKELRDSSTEQNPQKK